MVRYGISVGRNRVENHIYIFNKEFLEDLVTHVGFNLIESGMRRPGLSKETHIMAEKLIK